MHKKEIWTSSIGLIGMTGCQSWPFFTLQNGSNVSGQTGADFSTHDEYTPRRVESGMTGFISDKITQILLS